MLFLVFLAPFFLVDLGALFIQGPVLLSFLKFAVMMSVALFLALLAAFVVSSPILLFALVRRGRRRFQAA